METTDNKYYNYILLDPRKPYKWQYKDYCFDFLPFYVGKGSGNRVKQHYYNSSNENPYKFNLIQKLKQGGFAPMYKIINTDCSEENALKEETILIAFIRDFLQEAVLTNIQDGGDNPPTHIGTDNTNATYVCQYDCNSGKFIRDWDTASEACKQLGYNPKNCKHITECCRGERRTALGFIWKFKKVDTVESEVNKKYSRISFNKLIAYNDNGEYFEFKTMKEAYQFLNESNKGKINAVLKGERKMYKGYFWKIE